MASSLRRSLERGETNNSVERVVWNDPQARKLIKPGPSGL
jgi:hypothetical protein